MEIHGHRGCRGLMPENTIAGFKTALELGVDAIELDLVVTKEKKLLVSHEPWFDHRYCIKPDGSEISSTEERALNLYEMAYDAIALYDCGSKGHPDFPSQKNEHHAKPLLVDVVKALRKFKSESFYFNIEVKSERRWYGDYQPEISEYAELVVQEIKQLRLREHCIVQSFDPAFLNALHKGYPKLSLALLVENDLDFEKNLGRLDFTPDFYNPMYTLVDKSLVDQVHKHDMKIFVWTVNEPEDGEKMKTIGVDGVITDYPNKFIGQI